MIQVTMRFLDGAISIVQYPDELVDDVWVEDDTQRFTLRSGLNKKASVDELIEKVNILRVTEKQDFQLDQWKLNDSTKVTLKSFKGGYYEGIFDDTNLPVTFDSHGYVYTEGQDHRYLKTSRNSQDKW